MIQELLADIELEVKRTIYEEQKSLVAVKTVIELIGQIDHEVEEVPLADKDRLSRLLVSLKGTELNADEVRLIDRIIST